VLPKGTAFITDLGMTGPVNSVIGVEPELAIGRFLTQMPTRFEPAKGPAALHGAVIRVDPDTGKALGIERLRVLASA
jgi:calcineurin-like phosphoesterase